MCNKQLRIKPVFLLSCGSFNPITVMHMRMMGKSSCIDAKVFYNSLLRM